MIYRRWKEVYYHLRCNLPFKFLSNNDILIMSMIGILMGYLKSIPNNIYNYTRKRLSIINDQGCKKDIKFIEF